MAENDAALSELAITTNPAGWPREVLPVFERAVTCEFATLTRKGTPITFPLTPYIGRDEYTLDVSTGLTYPAKAERARRNPKVGMLFSDAVGTGLARPPVVLVYGLASVRDTDLQANTDRYLRLSMAKLPAATKGTPAFMLRRMSWYYARIWIEVTPLRILWWLEGRVDETPQRWEAPEGTAAPLSDPAPTGRQPAAWKETTLDWRRAAAHAVNDLGLPVLTTVDGDGFPLPVRARRAVLHADGFALDLPAGKAAPAEGPACLTFHAHADVFTGQENKVFVGTVTADGDSAVFTVERPLADWSLSGSRLAVGWSFLAAGRKLNTRLVAEAARRGQPVPEVRLPK